MRHAWLAPLAAAAALRQPVTAQRPPVPIPPDLRTKSELTAFKSIETYEEVLDFCRKLERMSPRIHLTFFGTSGQGRKLPLVIATSEKDLKPETRWKSPKPVVLVLNSIHAGESDGTAASLILLRDIALTNRPEILEKVNLLLVPVYNVDGYARVSKYNRPNQNGPEEGMGFRTNAAGLDLNRDFMKAEAPETRALLALAENWKPDLFVDDHVTDGADIQPALTLDYAAEPVTAKPLVDWLDGIVPKVERDVQAGGWLTGPYVDWVDPLDPLKGIDSGPTQPRYSTGYFPLRSVPSILVETHAMKPFVARAKANERFLRFLLTRVGAHPGPLLEAREKAREEARKGTGPFVLDAKTDTSRPEPLDLNAYAYEQVLSPVTGKPVLRWDETKKVTLRLPFFPHATATRTVTRPAAYLVPAGWPVLEECLKAHGIRLERLEKARTLQVGTYRAEHPVFAAMSWQGRTRVTATIRAGRETRTVPAGSLYIPLDTELAPVIMNLLEPEAPDSLFAWGEVSTIFEQKEWADSRVLDPLAERMLRDDPKLAAEWTEKLKDPGFAADPAARRLFFDRRTPYWDETVGLVPVFRLDAPLPAEAFRKESEGRP